MGSLPKIIGFTRLLWLRESFSTNSPCDVCRGTAPQGRETWHSIGREGGRQAGWHVLPSSQLGQEVPTAMGADLNTMARRQRGSKSPVLDIVESSWAVQTPSYEMTRSGGLVYSMVTEVNNTVLVLLESRFKCSR